MVREDTNHEKGRMVREDTNHEKGRMFVGDTNQENEKTRNKRVLA